jgi:hypothetical protein
LTGGALRGGGKACEKAPKWDPARIASKHMDLGTDLDPLYMSDQNAISEC